MPLLLYVQVQELAANIYRQIPDNIDYNNTVKLVSVDPCPLNVVLLQEVSRIVTDLQKSIAKHKLFSVETFWKYESSNILS